jgi:hypothetical protein
MSAVVTMPRKKPNEPAQPEPTPRKVVLQMKGTDAWKEWLELLGKHLRTPTSTVVDHALVRYAKEMGFDREAPER